MRNVLKSGTASKAAFVALLLVSTCTYSFSQDKIGKIDLNVVFQQDPDTAVKNAQIRKYSDSIYQLRLPDLVALNTKFQSLDTNDKLYRYKADDIWQEIRSYQQQLQYLTGQKRQQLYFTRDLHTNAYWGVFLKDSLSCLLMYDGDNYLGPLFNTEEFAKKLNQDIDRLSKELLEYYEKTESTDYYRLSVLDKEDENYNGEVLALYLKYYAETIAVDYSQQLIKRIYKK